jgi:hypothetical protein
MAGAAAGISALQWLASFDPGSSDAVDEVPQARVIATWNATQVLIWDAVNRITQPVSGIFAGATIGAFPKAAVGGSYSFNVAVSLGNDTRLLKADAAVLCS